jgi:hypothetical protein
MLMKGPWAGLESLSSSHVRWIPVAILLRGLRGRRCPATRGLYWVCIVWALQ